ncbi:MAG: polysaccharide deacetylase family protein [Thiotrichales bacterium]|nr:MAG: polysaccharide deacetylase family protein [Thiotrichales bacterium]
MQDRWLSEIQQAVIGLFAEEDLKLSLGVVGGHIGKDEQLVRLIRSKQGVVSIANHGLHAKNSADGYSLLLTQAPEITRDELSQAERNLSNLFGQAPRTYIPHQNEFNDTIRQLISELGFTHISSACRRHINRDDCMDECSYDRLNPPCGMADDYNLIHVPSGASTQWQPAPGKGMSPVSQILDEISKSIDKYCFAVVMLHPQDFATADQTLDQKQLQSLRILLQQIKSAPDRFEVVWLEQIERRCP